MIKDSAGFISKRLPEGFLITSTGSNVGSLSVKDLALVTKVENGVVYWQGQSHPSSETPLITDIYYNLKDVNAVVHTHCKRVMYNPNMQNFTTMQYIRYGRFGESDKILDLLKKNEGFAIMRLHGELFVGDNLNSVRQKILRRTGNE